MSFFIDQYELQQLTGSPLKVDVAEEQETLKNEFEKTCFLVPEYK